MGDEKDVPLTKDLSLVLPFPLLSKATATGTLSPLATISGLILPSLAGPEVLKSEG